MEGKPKVYDPTEGMRHIGAEEFAERGSPWSEVRDIQLQGGPAFDIARPGEAAEAVKTKPMQQFNLAMMDMLKQYQGLSSADLMKRKNALLKAKYGKMSEITPDELRTFSPVQQAAIRRGAVEAYQPEIEELGVKTREREEKMRGFGSAFETAQRIGENIAKLEAPERRVIGKNLVQINPDGTTEILYETPEEEQDKDIKWSEDRAGNLWKIISDPTTGETISTENLGAYAKGFKPTGDDKVKITDEKKADLNKIVETLKEHPDTYDEAKRGFMDKYGLKAEDEFTTYVGKKGDVEVKQFLSKEYFRGIYTDKQLKASAKKAGFVSLWKREGQEIEEYLDHLMNVIEKYRKTGLTDQEILDKFPKK